MDYLLGTAENYLTVEESCYVFSPSSPLIFTILSLSKQSLLYISTAQYNIIAIHYSTEDTFSPLSIIL